MTSKTLNLCLLAGAMSLALIPAVAGAQAAKAKAAAEWKAPRSSDGHADLQGDWSNAYITQLERPGTYGERKALTPQETAALEGDAAGRFEEGNKPTDPNAPATDTTSKNCQGAGGLDCGYNSGWKDSGTQVARVGGEPRTSFITSTPNGRIPTPIAGAGGGGRGRGGPPGAGGAPGGRGGPPGAGGAPGAGRPARAVASNEGGEGAAEPTGLAARGINDNPEQRSLGERCLMSFGNSAGPIMLPLMYNNTYQIVQSKEAVVILVEMVHDARVVRLNSTHRTDGVRPYMGDSIGHWDGDTLVVETTNYHPSQSLRGSSANLKVTEKFTRKGPNRLLYQFTAEDPTVWTQPWGGEYEFMSAKGGVFEYACHEGNYGLEGILAGAREEERLAAEKATPPVPTGVVRPRADLGAAPAIAAR